MPVLTEPDGRVNGVRIRLALPDDFDILMKFSQWCRWAEDGIAVADYVAERDIRNLLPQIKEGRIFPSGEGFIVIAEREEPVGCLYCEFQRYEKTGEYVALLGNLYCISGVPLKTAHRMIKFAGGLIWGMGICKVMLSVQDTRSDRAYRHLGARPVFVLYEADLSEGMQELKKRGV